ncbi:MAG TPA: DEAD/DEAH box helicase, partial [Candidatus Sulfotelmatobacter sp.]|nr:DEAD/DEAH box helicase [Candidatus Sulfotelmatobacter sp.]
MQANIVIVGATRGFEKLTYSIPPALDGLVEPGHRVLAPLRSRKVTGLVTEVGERLSTTELKPILEVLEPQPLFDRAHLQLMEFLATYYMVSIADAYRSVIPAVARVESRTAYRIATAPDALARAAFTRIERAIIETIEKHAATTRQLERMGAPSAVRATIARFVADGVLERRDATVGRHRETSDLIAHVVAEANVEAVRGSKQREVLHAIANAGAAGVRVEDLKNKIDGASAVLKRLARRGLIAIEAVRPAAHHGAAPGFDLTDEQQVALDAISPSIERRRYEAFLLWGVTASGKTEIYLNLAARALAAGRNVLIMVPEIALADEIVRSFRARFGALVAIAHSAQSVSERWASWMAAIGGHARVMIGPRSAIFAPLHDIGLIVVDEEHDASYKNEEGIYYHARDLAVALAGYSKCPVVLGSATPSSESYANARRGRYRLLRLLRRVNDRAMASVEVVDLRREVAESRKRAAAGTIN